MPRTELATPVPSPAPMPITAAVTAALSAMETMLKHAPEMSVERISLWCQVLAGEGITPGEIAEGTRRACATLTWFPTAAEFIELCRPKADWDVIAEASWQRCLDLLRRYGSQASLSAEDFDGDGRALWALSRVGWERLGRELGDENRAIFRADYVRNLKVAHETRQHLAVLPGWLERQARGAAVTITPAMCGRLDWTTLPEGDCPAPALPRAAGKMLTVKELLP